MSKHEETLQVYQSDGKDKDGRKKRRGGEEKQRKAGRKEGRSKEREEGRKEGEREGRKERGREGKEEPGKEGGKPSQIKVSPRNVILHILNICTCLH